MRRARPPDVCKVTLFCPVIVCVGKTVRAFTVCDLTKLVVHSSDCATLPGGALDDGRIAWEFM